MLTTSLQTSLSGLNEIHGPRNPNQLRRIRLTPANASPTHTIPIVPGSGVDVAVIWAEPVEPPLSFAVASTVNVPPGKYVCVPVMSKMLPGPGATVPVEIAPSPQLIVAV